MNTPAQQLSLASGDTLAVGEQGESYVATSGDTASGFTYTWALGLTIENNQIVAGYYDAEKTREKDGDDLLCWAGTASNMIAWWQNYYGMTDNLGYDVLTSEDDIFDLIEANWYNSGGNPHDGCWWWFAGDTSMTYKNGTYYTGTHPGAFYSQFYSRSGARKTSYHVDVKGSGGLAQAQKLAAVFEGGGMVGLSITKYEDGQYLEEGHAITLWGVERDSAGYLSALFITDSDDYAHKVVRVNVSYNETLGRYHLTDYSSRTYYLRGYDVLLGVGQAGFNAPSISSLRATQQGTAAVFSWNAGSRAGVRYEFAYKLSSAEDYQCLSCEQESLALNLSTSGDYSWCVRALVGSSYVGKWALGGVFTYDITAPVLSFSGASLQKVSTGKTTVTFSWASDESATFSLVLDGSLVYTGTGTSATRSFTLGDGNHSYTLTATDAAGNTSSKSGSFVCDTGDVPAPSNLRVRLENQGRQAYFSWGEVYDKDGITYQLACKYASDSDYTIYDDLSIPSIGLNLNVDGNWVWCVRAVDGNGNASGWVFGSSFNNDCTAPEITLNTPNLKKSGKNKTKVTLSWSANESATYVLVVDGKQVSKGKGSSKTITLADGEHHYTVTATDAVGHSSSLSGSFICDTGIVATPANLRVELSEQGRKAAFSWGEVYDRDGVTYELGCRTKGSKNYEVYDGLSSPSIGLKLLVDANWEWRVRAVDGNGNASAWTKVSRFNNDLTAPEITLSTPTLKKSGKGKMKVTLKWSANEKCSYVLVVDGKQVYKGKGGSKTVTLGDGDHRYTLTATDAAGNASHDGGSFVCDTGVVAAPANLRVELSEQGRKATFSWGEVYDKDGITYELGCRTKGSKNYELYDELSSPSIGLKLLVDANWEWRVRAVDGNGNASVWTKVSRFNNDLTAPVITLNSPTFKRSGNNKTKTTFKWSANEKSSYVLVVDGKQVYKGKGGSKTITVGDGEHRYTLTATDAAGNTSSESGSFVSDSIAPAAPRSLGVTVQNGGQSATFSWDAVGDASGVTYEMGCRTSGSKNYSTYTDLSNPAIGLNLLVVASWEWRVRAVDGAGNASAWVQGSGFSNDATSWPSLLRLDQELGLSSGLSACTTGSLAESSLSAYEKPQNLLACAL